MTKRLLCLGLAAVLLTSAPSHAAEKRIGSIVSAGTNITNATTATAFTVPSNSKISIQCTTAAYVEVCETTTCVASSTVSPLIEAGQLFPTSTPSTGTGAAGVAVIPVSGSSTCKVFIRRGNEN